MLCIKNLQNNSEYILLIKYIILCLLLVAKYVANRLYKWQKEIHVCNKVPRIKLDFYMT